MKYFNKQIDNGNLIILPIERFFDCSLFLRKSITIIFLEFMIFHLNLIFLKNKKKKFQKI